MSTHVVFPSKGHNHTHTIIFLHGRDSTASEFAPEFFESQASTDLTLPEIYPTVKWVFPTSKLRVSARFNTEMSQWFDMWSVENPAEKMGLQRDGLRESVLEIVEIIKQEALIVPLEKIVLGGISQGCAVAFHALLYSGLRLGGFVGLCSWLPYEQGIKLISAISAGEDARKQIVALVHGEISDLPVGVENSVFQTSIFLSHSTDDDVVSIQNGESLSKALNKVGFGVTWKEYPDGGHWINEPQGVDDIVEFLNSKIKSTQSTDSDAQIQQHKLNQWVGSDW